MVEKRVGPQERGGKSAKRSEKRETSTIEMTGLKEAMLWSQRGGMADKRYGEAQGRHVVVCISGHA